MTGRERRKASTGAGFVNEAFNDDGEDDVERRMSYASWMNQAQAETSVDYVDLSFNRDSASASVISELDQKLKSKKKKKDSKPASGTSGGPNNDDTFYRKPDGTVSRSAMLKKISRKSRNKSLGEVCTDQTCPYNKWLYKSENFPSSDMLETWREKKLPRKPELRLNPKTLPAVPPRVSSRVRSPESGFRSPSFSYSRFTPESPIVCSPSASRGPGAPLPWNVYSSSPRSLSSSYPIITLPRSLRQSDKKRSSIFGNVFTSRNDLNTSESVIKTRPPSSRASSRSESGSSSSCSSCSSCSCSCSSSGESQEAHNETHNPVLSLSKNPFLLQEKKSPVRSRRLTPPCDLTCYVITAFTVLCLAGVFAAFLYVYVNNLTESSGKDKN